MTAKSLLLILLLLAVLVVLGLGFFLWWRKRKTSGRPADRSAPGSETPSDVNRICELLRDAERILRDSVKMKGASLSTLPAFLVIGPAGSGKTSFVERSGMDRKLLAGQVYSDGAVTPTKHLNIWLAAQSVFIEVSGQSALDPVSMEAILRQLTPRGVSSLSGKDQPVRGIILCMDQATVAAAKVPDDIAALALPWNAALERAAEIMGVQLPVYVVFTRIDGIPGCAEYFSNLSAKEQRQALGATIKPFNPAAPGVYAQDMEQVLNREFSGIASALVDARVPLLSRQQDGARIPLEYPFPRDFQKLKKNVTQFLLDLARPSQLHVSPFLRGFYFTGTRSVPADPLENREVQVAPETSVKFDGATSFIKQGIPAAPAPQSPPGRPGEMTVWLFLPPLLEFVILQDKSALRVSAKTSRTDRTRALLIGAAGAMGLLLLLGLSVSYVRNRNLEKDLIAGARLAGENAPGTSVRRLDELRRPLVRLLGYRRTGVDLSMRWGLYSGENLLPQAEAAYCGDLRQQVLGPVLQQIAAHLSALAGASPGNAEDLSYLKAYMMMTTHPQKALDEDSFLSQTLLDAWSQTPNRATSEAPQLIAEQFRTYGALLPLAEAQGACVFPAGPGIIRDAQHYLRQLNLNDRYQSLLQQAGKGLDPVGYSKDPVIDSKVVPGWFTKQGWAQMQQILANPAKYLQADDWVLGEANQSAPRNQDTMAKEQGQLVSTYRSHYLADYVRAWKDFLSAARVAPYADLTDGANKLERIASAQSALLNLIGVAADHAAPLGKINLRIFEPASAVVPSPGDFQPDAEYLTALGMLKNQLTKAAASSGPAHEKDIQEARDAETPARNAVDKIALSPKFREDTGVLVKSILLMPITQIDAMLNRQNEDAVKSATADLCRAYGQLAHTLPFSGKAQQFASLEDVQALFQPEKGQMWKVYNETLRDSLDCAGPDCVLRSSPRFNLPDNFVKFFRTLNRWDRILYGVTADPVMHLQLRATSQNHVKALELQLDDQRISLPVGAEFQNVTWDLRKGQKLQVAGTFEGEAQGQDLFRTDGRWAIFRWLYDAENGSGGPAGFTWLPRVGLTTPAQLPNGNTKQYSLEIKSGDGKYLELPALGVSCASSAGH